MTLLQKFWHYWKSLCVTLVTATVLLLALATLINHFKSPPPPKEIGECLDKGGTWDEGEGVCKSAA